MKTVKIKVGVRDRYDKKYMDGRCTVRGMVLDGSPEKVQLAEALRLRKLDYSASQLHEKYTALSVKELDTLFADRSVNCLSELIAQDLEQMHFFMLSLCEAEKILYAERLGKI